MPHLGVRHRILSLTSACVIRPWLVPTSTVEHRHTPNMEIEVVLADGSTKRVKSTTMTLCCPDCGDVPEEMWEWSYFEDKPQPLQAIPSEGDKRWRLGQSPDSDVTVLSPSFVMFIDEFTKWFEAVSNVRIAAPGVLRDPVVKATFEVHGAHKDLQASYGTQVVEGKHGTYLRDAGLMAEALTSLHDCGESLDVDAIPPHSIGVCKTHKELVQRTPTPIFVDIASDGLLTIRDGGGVVFGASPGQWMAFLEVAGDTPDAEASY